ncbi:pantoate--beta-alanine ligase [Pseudolysinimonas kribbensis]|uniref:Pantothenate synthetase n=1 Tax=Pseudolysinimonas kribbensis TaxID=433641 RepID=A0ABQ6K4Q8_9MICO|nr:pantoate--beta-alanine ligase [Pseudolysinimonas kribbensis]GMA95408.1 pantothenate synthetase [Pseudolysinimonas kribbensis]
MSESVVVTTIAGMRSALAGRGPVALVPTMGALHEGHLALVDRAREVAATVVVSIFVNPTQFAAGEDLSSYPRDPSGDLAALATRAVEFVFAPDASEMYPDGPTQVTVHAGAVAETFEGASRPGHFDGVLTVVAKLLHIVQPTHVLFGQKDAQQLFLVQRMVRDLDLPVTVEPVPTVRADDGLALSSRNRYLDEEHRRASVALSTALRAAADAAGDGVDAALAAAREVLTSDGLVKLDYLAVVDPRTFRPVDAGYRGTARMLVAARVGPARLIDNDAIHLT